MSRCFLSHHVGKFGIVASREKAKNAEQIAMAIPAC